MKLFNLKEFNVVVEPEALLLAPFATIWNRDKTTVKEVAMKELAYVWFMQDVKSDFFAIVNEKERSEAVKKALKLDTKWKADKKIKEAEEFYIETSTSLVYRMLIDARSGLENLSSMVNPAKNPNFKDLDIKKVADVMLLLPKLAKSLDEMEETVLKESETQKHKGSQERAIFEDGL